MVDVGCGVGDETARLAAPDRLVVGVDYSAETMRAAGADHSDGPRTEVLCGRRRRACRCATAASTAIVSSHIIEHFTNPALHVAELARVLRPDGTAFVITPNAPADFENPFHVYLFEPSHLVSLLALFFEDVTCLGLEGDDVLHADFAARRASGERLLKLDLFGLRHRIPKRTYVWTYERSASARLPACSGSDKHRHRLGPRRGRTSSPRELHRRPTPGLFAVARPARGVGRRTT